ncbi:MAG: 2-hydroxyacid dehydrogenase [Cryomorphaceae bacterium]|nr:2-hydroxyacid dehydrogenase [Cryomorphaceae bacterium]
MNVFIYSIHGFDKPFLAQAAGNNHKLGFTEEALTIHNVNLCRGYDALALFSNDDASAPVLDAIYAQGIRWIALRSVGYDHIDLKHAKALGIKVANVPEYSPYAIAEHGVGMLLMHIRKLYESQLLLQLQDFRLDTLVGFDLHGKTIGIIGTGKIGFAFAKIMSGFGCKLLAYDPVENPEADAIGMNYTDLDNLLGESDVISINCPLNDHTHYMIDTPQLALMKPGAILMNTARGAIVNTKAMISALESGHLGGACLDVYEKEKGWFFYDHRNTILKDEMYARLRNFKNVLITGHQAFLTREALEGIAQTTMDNLSDWEKSGKSKNDLI